MSDNILNYIWIKNPFASPGNENGTVSAVPQHYLENAFRISNEHPHIDVIVWYDSSLHSNQEIQALEKTSNKPKNLVFRDLNEIREYVDDPVTQQAASNAVYDSYYKNPIWKKVDLTRIIVLDYLFRTTTAEVVFYSDFDIMRPDIDTKHSQAMLGRDGALFMAAQGKSFDPTLNYPGSGQSYLENQFIGFSRRLEKLLRNDLLPNTRDCCLKGGTGWPALCNFVYEHIMRSDEEAGSSRAPSRPTSQHPIINNATAAAACT